jgi:predicted TIM-barrel fold metal-dependent hydrolase
LAKRGTAKVNSNTDSITDTHVYVGHWPHQTLAHDTPESLRAALQRNNITQAWVGSFDALFHKDIATVNQRLFETCGRAGAGMLLPFGAINPMLPDWEDDVRRCHETFHMPGIRLHPNYHGYSLDDPRFAQLLNLAATRGLIVQLVGCVDKEKHLWLNPRTPAVDLHPLVNEVADVPGLKLVVAGGTHALEDGLAGELARRKNMYFDFADTQARNASSSEPVGLSRRGEAPAEAGPGGSRKTDSTLDRLLDQVSSERLLIGSVAPLHSVEAALVQLKQAQLKDDDRRAIESSNARKLLTAG